MAANYFTNEFGFVFLALNIWREMIFFKLVRDKSLFDVNHSLVSRMNVQSHSVAFDLVFAAQNSCLIYFVCYSTYVEIRH